MSRALKRRTDPAPLSPPPSDWCRSRTGSRALFGLLQPLDHLGGDVKARVDGQEDAAVLTVHIEDQRVVGFGADALDDPDDPGLDRLRVDEGDLERALRLRAENGRCGRDQPDPRPHCHYAPHNYLPE